MKNKIATLLLYVCLLLSYGCKQKKSNNLPNDGCNFLAMYINGHSCAVDCTAKIFLYPIKEDLTEFNPFIEIQNVPEQFFVDGREVENYSDVSFGPVKVGQSIPVQFKLCNGVFYEYQLIFTNLAVIQIHTNGVEIQDEPKQAVKFEINDPHYEAHGLIQNIFRSTVGIEHRGSSSQANIKLSFGLELWSDETGNDKIDYPLLGMRNDDDWILDAAFRDYAKMRNRVSTDIWLAMHPLYYQDDEPLAQAGSNGLFVEVFKDDRYHGLFNLMERLDRKQLQLKKSEDNEVEGLFYKAIQWSQGLVTFDHYFPADPSSIFWDGWEQKYPAPDDFIHWQDLEVFSQFVVESSDDLFINQISEKIVIPNVIDYFLLLNLIRGDDNRGKNVYLAKYQKDQPFIIIPWDMDATWGRDFLGNPTSTAGIVSNGLLDRLLETDPNHFRNQVKARWSDLRANIFSTAQLKSYFNQYFINFETTGAYEREIIRWDFNYDLPSEKTYIENWMDQRVLFLDDYFQNL